MKQIESNHGLSNLETIFCAWRVVLCSSRSYPMTPVALLPNRSKAMRAPRSAAVECRNWRRGVGLRLLVYLLVFSIAFSRGECGARASAIRVDGVEPRLVGRQGGVGCPGGERRGRAGSLLSSLAFFPATHRCTSEPTSQRPAVCFRPASGFRGDGSSRGVQDTRWASGDRSTLSVLHVAVRSSIALKPIPRSSESSLVASHHRFIVRVRVGDWGEDGAGFDTKARAASGRSTREPSSSEQATSPRSGTVSGPSKQWNESSGARGCSRTCPSST